MNHRIRTATPDDGEAVSTLLSSSYPVLMRSAYDARTLGPALEFMTHAQPALLESGTFYLAQDDAGDIVGCGGWTREYPQDGTIKHGIGHVRHFATHPDWLGHGIGRAIFERCKTAAHDAGIEYFECLASLNAVGFYESLGFIRIREIEVAMGAEVRLPSVYMRLSF
jgi:N-acetylglutamate synthase-like GNAT family acetyltransferase